MPVMAQIAGTVLDLPNFDPIEVVNVTFAIAILIAAGLAVVHIFLAGIKLITSGGDGDATTTAIKTISHTIVGIVITILSIAVVGWVGKFFGFDLTGYLSFESLLKIINTWMGQARPDTSGIVLQ